jgi:RHS repeat-associated protein
MPRWILSPSESSPATSESGNDYAVNRYMSPGMGRFLTPDPYTASGGPADPGSWNHYAYTRGDPINRHDPSGLQDCDPDVDFCAGDPGPTQGGEPGGGDPTPTPGPGGGEPGPVAPGPYSAPTGTGFDKTQGKEIQSAINLAMSWTKNPKCNNALQSAGIAGINPNDTLSAALGLIHLSGSNQNVWNGTNSTYEIEYNNGSGVQTSSVAAFFKLNAKTTGGITASTQWGQEVFLGYAFLDPSDYITGFQVGYTADAQALEILHEAVHLFGSAFQFSDAAFGGSKALTNLLVTDCIPALAKQLGSLVE